MKLIFQLNHPAHYHLFKHAIAGMRDRGHQVLVAVRDKDILLDLVQGEEVVNIAGEYRKHGLLSVGRDLIDRDRRVLALARRWKPDLMVGTAVEITHAGRLLGIPSIFVGEDDARAVLLGAAISNPFATHVLSPESCDNWIWNRKTIAYRGFQKLAYLHPRYFTPDPARVAALEQPYSLLRLSALAAYHDRGRQGLEPAFLRRLIARLREHGAVYITSEKALDPDLEQHRLPVGVHEIHHVLHHAMLFIGDSQSMAMEAAMLGVPNVRVSDFVGKIGVLNEVEGEYRLSLGFRPGETERIEAAVEELTGVPGTRQAWAERRRRMIAEKISVTDFMIWLFENYPHSIRTLRDDPDYQLRFRDAAAAAGGPAAAAD